jgi:hypothetical protein
MMDASNSAGTEMDDLNAPATKADVQRVTVDLQQVTVDLQQVTADLQQVKNELAGKATKGDLLALGESLTDSLTETMRDVQTELLKAFYSFAKSTEAKLSDAEISDHLIRQRVSAVESRITEIERRLNLPPAA